MSETVKDARALFALRIERAGDHRRMVIARREVVAQARARVLPRVEPANDADLEVA